MFFILKLDFRPVGPMAAIWFSEQIRTKIGEDVKDNIKYTICEVG